MSEALPAIGSLTDRVSFERRVDVDEEAGGHHPGFIGIGSVWARVRALSARQIGEADARGMSQSHMVVVRHRTDVQPGDRFGYRGRWLEVLATEDLNGGRAFLGCRCTETGVMG